MKEQRANNLMWWPEPIDDGILIRSIIDDLEDGVYILNPERRILYWNHAAEQITGYKAKEIVGKHCPDNLLNHMDKLGHLLCLSGCPMDASLCDGKRHRVEAALRHKNGYRVSVQVKTVPLIQQGNIIAAIQIFTQMDGVTDGYGQLLEVLTERTMTDGLTGLKNRSYMQAYLEHKLKEHRRFKRLFCVLFMDIDDFGSFNNTYGHNHGDEILKAIASNITDHLRGTDIMGRWGGEEFLGVFTIAVAKDALVMAKKVLELVKGTKILYEGRPIHVTCSAGAAIARDGDTPDSIIKRADDHMYRSKGRGKNRISVEGFHDADIGI